MEGAKPLWEIRCGEGFAGAAVANDQLALFDRDGNVERLRLIAAESGKVIWTAPLSTVDYRGTVVPNSGPLCVPILLKDCVITYGIKGNLTCVDRADGHIRWTRALRKEYQAEDGYFGAGSTPIVVDDLIIVNVGGKKRGGIVGIRLDDGISEWNVTNVESAYASPIALSMNPKTVLVPTQLASIGLDPRTGEVRFQVPFGQRGPSAVGATPVQLPTGNVFLTASYGTDSTLFQPMKESAKIIYKEQPVFSSHFMTPVFVDGILVGSDGREDYRSGLYKAVDPFTKEVFWIDGSIKIAHTIAIGSRLLIVDVEGIVTLAEATKKELRVIAKFTLPEDTYRALPAYSNGRLFLRGQSRLLAYQL
jgi:outer membrane protein assembly factor BamB